MANKIYLRYGNYVSGTLTYETAVEFNPPILRPINSFKRIASNDLRDINFSHLKSSRTKNYEIVLSANDLSSSTKFTFMVNFFKADAIQYNLTNEDWDTEAVLCSIDDSGDMPIDYINNHKLLRRLKFNLIQKYPD
jgi:hypothetical protein